MVAVPAYAGIQNSAYRPTPPIVWPVFPSDAVVDAPHDKDVMFQQRLTWFWVLLTGLAMLIVGRLVHVQVVQAEHYEELAQRILTRPVRYIGAPRGAILDRNGTPLLSDEPTSNINVHYALLADPDRPGEDYLVQVARALKRRGDYPPETKLRAIADLLAREEVPWMWARLAELVGLSEGELRARAAAVCEHVARVRAAVGRRSPNIEHVAEENQLLPLVENVGPEAALAARLELESFPWLRVVPSSRRVAHEADALVHVLGRMGAAGPRRIATDPLAGDELRALRPGDRCGISGIERVAETGLRGTRGRIVEDYDRRVLERIEPVPGHDVTLTIDLELQEHVLGLLEAAVKENDDRTGAAAVVIDVETREVRALVSYPVYSYDRFGEDYEQMRRDAKSLPTMFRAVQAAYPPGSTCKVITSIAGLSEGVVSAGTRFHCTGHLLPDRVDRFRCWIYTLNPGWTHDMTDNPDGQDGVSAIRNSCNIYFFKVGGLLGAERLCDWFSRLGLGRTQGTHLIEESPGVVPDAQWLMSHQGREPRASDAWNFAIGQGEVSATPLQAANVAASVASGYWAPVHLAQDSTGRAFGPPPEPVKPLDEAHMRVVRQGMWEVVNAVSGTAKDAKLSSEAYELCGKTGSAQAQPRPIEYRYTFEWPDGRREEVRAYLEEDALARFGDEKPERVGKHTVRRHPVLEEGARLPSHAWFIGFTQPADTPRGARPRGKVYAISVVIEFGGSGGRVAGPVVKEIAEYLVGED